MNKGRFFAAMAEISFCVVCVSPLFGQQSLVQTSQTQSSPTAGPTLEQRHPRYIIQRSDVLMLSFPLSPELNQSVSVQPDGYINLQNTHSVYVQGLTAPEVSETVKNAYAGILHNPIINVDIQDYQKPFFTVTGQVGKPGQYELRQDTTISEAVAVAGGLTPAAKTQILIYHKVGDQWVAAKKFNLKAILNGKNIEEDAHLQPGDMIFIPEKAIFQVRKYIPYSVGTGTYVSY
jgi:polysaccharide biosynthesis/export protein